MPAVMTSCKDYDDQINDLQGQIDSIRLDVDKFIKLIESGSVITNVTSSSDGVVFTLSDGKSYTITNGKNGENGTPGTAWTIGDDGYWYENGKKTSYRAIGQDGATGPQGPKGEAGAAGQNGEYYVPNVKTGNFDIYKDGKYVKDSGISWRTSGGVTAAYVGNVLTLSWVNDRGETVSQKVNIGSQMGTIAFVPSVLSNVGGYPTTDKPFYHVESYLDNAKYTSGTYKFIPQTQWNRSNEVNLQYRISPQDAYIPEEGVFGAFINRVVTTRATNDMKTLMNVASFDAAGASASGVLDVKATYNKTAKTNTGNDIAAFQLIYGQVPFTTDYIAPTSKGINVEIVNPVATKAGNAAVTYYTRDVAITSASAETSDFIQNIAGVSLTKAPNLEVQYSSAEGLDLAPLVDLYTPTEKKFLTELDFNRACMSYEFSLPESYLSNDAQKTNQQWFAELVDGHIIKANSKNLTNGLTPAKGRTPVVRVDAYMEDNLGEAKRLVASSYIKLVFVETPSKPGTDVTYDPYYMTVKKYEYHNLKSNWETIGQMQWQDVNNQIYGIANLSSDNFWNYYGGTQDNYNVKITTTQKNGQEKVIANTDAHANQPLTLTADGIKCEVTLGNGATQTSNILFQLDNKVKTENTYKDINSDGAEYQIVITINSDNIKSRGDIKVIQKFYVREDCTPYAYNPNYYLPTFSYDGKTYNDCVVTKGTNKSGKWELKMAVAEAFKMINGQNIFSYYNTVNNVTAINFTLPNITANSGVAYDATNKVISLSDAMTTEYKVAQLNYNTTLVNGETCDFKLYVVFQNPFKSASPLTAQTLKGNAIGKQTVDVKPSVKVVDTQNNAIYSWVTNALKLSSVATDTYKLTSDMISVKYEFVKNQAYNDFYSQLDIAGGAVFGIDASTGVVTYDNLGATLQVAPKLTVRATVTVNKISVVTCDIPFNVTK